MRPSHGRTDLERIPGVGPSISQDLRDLGMRRVEDLHGADPEAMYEHLCLLRGQHIDRCAVYFAGHSDHDPELLKWWNWKDEAQPTAILQ